jgi:uncharacterized membrane protein YgdD (TMEM256/DUF423 family)
MIKSSNNNIVSKIGVIIGFLGVLMGVVGVSMFTYQGHNLSPFFSDIGKYCFFYCFPTFLLGILLSFYPNKK